VDVFNPESATRTGTDIYINPASQEIYAEFYNGLLGTELEWEEIFAQTDRDINLQRVMNVLHYGAETGCHDWIPDRAIGPTDDPLYEAEAGFNDRELEMYLGEPLNGMPTGKKRGLLMNFRKQQLRRLIDAYYQERGWNSSGIPLPDTLKQLGLWDFLSSEARSIIEQLI
jgi:aldehyde:ferredoxin oxidoreductase